MFRHEEGRLHTGASLEDWEKSHALSNRQSHCPTQSHHRTPFFSSSNLATKAVTVKLTGFSLSPLESQEGPGDFLEDLSRLAKLLWILPDDLTERKRLSSNRYCNSRCVSPRSAFGSSQSVFRIDRETILRASTQAVKIAQREGEERVAHHFLDCSNKDWA